MAGFILSLWMRKRDWADILQLLDLELEGCGLTTGLLLPFSMVNMLLGNIVLEGA